MRASRMGWKGGLDGLTEIGGDTYSGLMREVGEKTVRHTGETGSHQFILNYDQALTR